MQVCGSQQIYRTGSTVVPLCGRAGALHVRVRLHVRRDAASCQVTPGMAHQLAARVTFAAYADQFH